MTPDEIKAALAERGYQLKDLAALEGVSQSSVSHVLRGARHASMAERIAELLGLTVDDIWPGNYRYHRRERYRDRNVQRRAA